jgi:amino acid transporter
MANQTNQNGHVPFIAILPVIAFTILGFVVSAGSTYEFLIGYGILVAPVLTWFLNKKLHWESWSRLMKVGFVLLGVILPLIGVFVSFVVVTYVLKLLAGL